MQIFASGNTQETAERLREYMPDELKPFPIVINLGNSHAKIPFIPTQGRYDLINQPENCKRCRDKEYMLRELEQAVPTVKRINITKIGRVAKLYAAGKRLVLRSHKGYFNVAETFEGFLRKRRYADFATLVEEKAAEYRVLVYKGKPFRVCSKKPFSASFAWKQDNCRFVEVPLSQMREDVLEICGRAAKILNIDLCGVDILLNTQLEPKVLEVNSGAAMCTRSVHLLYERLVGEWLHEEYIPKKFRYPHPSWKRIPPLLERWQEEIEIEEIIGLHKKTAMKTRETSI